MTEPMAAAPAAEPPADQRLDALRRTTGLFLGPAALVAVMLLPMPALSVEAHRLAAIVTLVVVWWVTEAIPIPITALAGTALTVLFGVADPAEAFAPFADPLIFLFLGSFILSRGVVEHGLDRRLAAALLAMAAIGGSLSRTRIAIGVVAMAASAWMSNMVVTAMMLPVVLGVLAAQLGSHAAAPQWRSSVMLVLAYAAAIGGMTTPVGAAPNLITIGLLDSAAGVQISFLTWMAVAVPIALVLIVALAGAAAWTMPPGALAIRQRTGGGAPHGGWTAGQRNAAIAFAVAVILWIGPSVLGAIAPDAAFSQWAIARVTEPIAAIVAATLLFVLPVDWARRQFTLGWTEASRIDWGTILLLGGGFSLGRLMFRTGLAEQIASSLVAVSGAESLWAITAIATAVAIIMTELTSNTATANMLVPVAISLSQVAGVNPIPPALGTGLGVSLAFMLPVSTPSNAIVYGTGLVPIRTMIRFGILMDVVGFAIIVAGLRVMCPLLGLA